MFNDWEVVNGTMSYDLGEERGEKRNVTFTYKDGKIEGVTAQGKSDVIKVLDGSGTQTEGKGKVESGSIRFEVPKKELMISNGRPTKILDGEKGKEKEIPITSMPQKDIQEMFLRSVKVVARVASGGVNNAHPENEPPDNIKALVQGLDEQGVKNIAIPMFETKNIIMDILDLVGLGAPIRFLWDSFQVALDVGLNNLTSEYNRKLNERLTLSGAEGYVLILYSGSVGPGKRLANIRGDKIPTIIMVGKTDIELSEIMNKYTQRVIQIAGDGDGFAQAQWNQKTYNVETVSIVLKNTDHHQYFTERLGFLTEVAQRSTASTKVIEDYLNLPENKKFISKYEIINRQTTFNQEVQRLIYKTVFLRGKNCLIKCFTF